MLRLPKLPAAAATVVLKPAWNWSVSVMAMVPIALRFPLTGFRSSVTPLTVGSPMTAMSLVPLMVKLTSLVVPSMAVTVKVSILLSPAPKYWVALLATV